MSIVDIIVIGLMGVVILHGFYTIWKIDKELRRMTEDPHYSLVFGSPKKTKDDVT